MSRQGSILFIDAYDSFSNNIVCLLKAEIAVSVEVIKIDDKRFVLNDDAFFSFLHGFDAVVAGPGPGHPANQADVGLIVKLWTLPDEHILPVLGICLGLQSMALEFGATIERLNEPRHGMVMPILHCGRDIFADTGDVTATLYHSLHAKLDHRKVKLAGRTMWSPSKSCKELIPLGWDFSDPSNGGVLMATRHCHKPFWAVQYHPESICTNDEGRKLIINWWNEVRCWQTGRPIKHPLNGMASSNEQKTNPQATPNKVVQWQKIQLPDDIEVSDVAGILRCDAVEPILLESGMRHGRPVNAETGRYSIIGLQDGISTHIRYSTSSRQLKVVAGSQVVTRRKATMSDVFEYLQTFVETHKALNGPPNVPFWGGLIGFTSYEAGLETINISPSKTHEGQADVWFVFVERSIVVDNIDLVTYVQSIREGDQPWLAATMEHIQELNQATIAETVRTTAMDNDMRIVSEPHKDEYCEKVRRCQEHLRAGSSYELCLTDSTLLRTEMDQWSLYLRLRDFNPAPFGAYIRLVPPNGCADDAAQGVSIISSSPERFLSWSRDGRCQFRPIKGTVNKTADMTRAKAEELLNCPKERAENLMIVDLIRHDLNGVDGVRNVRVPKLMSVEEYETVYQLVSVIEGDMTDNSGIRALAASLPPGSMTGAPKRRSCELLKEIENHKPRGLYSGVLGYLDVGGGGDFSVVIRTAFKWDNDSEWRVGAGGAVTALSDPEAEWQEMLAKRESLLRAFS